MRGSFGKRDFEVNASKVSKGVCDHSECKTLLSLNAVFLKISLEIKTGKESSKSD